jgi:hypothetical protein
MEENKVCVKKLVRRLKRMKKQLSIIQEEQSVEHAIPVLNFWAGYTLGYTKGKIAEIENVLDELGVSID